MDEKNVTSITVDVVKIDVSELITKCDGLIQEAEALYISRSNKPLHDAITLLHSAKRSLNEVSLN